MKTITGIISVLVLSLFLYGGSGAVRAEETTEETTIIFTLHELRVLINEIAERVIGKIKANHDGEEGECGEEYDEEGGKQPL